MNVCLKIMNKYKLHAGTYDFEYYLVIAHRSESKKILNFIHNICEDSSLEYDFTDSCGACFTRFNYKPVIWLPQKPKTPKEYATLAHECLHIVNYILLRWVDIPLSMESEEAYTHLLGKIIKDILTKLQS